MSFGIGLGGFIEGLTRGVGLKQQQEDRETAKVERAEDRAWRAEEMDFRREDRAYQQEERAFDRSERNRTVQNRDRLSGIQSDARAVFEEGVEAGDYKATEFESFYNDYALPKMRNEMILQGDVAGASALTEWSDSENAKKGRKAFGEAMFLSGSGQHGAALDKAIEAGRVSGYIGDGYEISDKEELQTEDGTLVGYRLTMKDADGNETHQEVGLDDIGTLVTQFANPEAAWAGQVAATTRKRERTEKLEDHEAEAIIDNKYAKTGVPTRSKVIETIRKRLEAASTMSDEEDVVVKLFDDMTPEEQETAIQEEMDLQTGSSTPQVPAGKVVVDTQSGKPVATSEQIAQQPGLGQSTKPTPPDAPGKGIGSTPGAPRPAPVINGQADPGLAAPPTETETLNTAAQEMVNGGNPQQIAQRLQALQIPPEKWPSSVKQVLTQTGH